MRDSRLGTFLSPAMDGCSASRRPSRVLHRAAGRSAGAGRLVRTGEGSAVRLAPRSADEALIARLLAVISGDAPRADAERLLAPDVISHMDQFTVRGIDVWYDWLDFLRSKAQGKVTAVDLTGWALSDGTITAYG